MNKISNVLMHIDNASLQSFARGGPGSNGKSVGVGELREERIDRELGVRKKRKGTEANGNAAGGVRYRYLTHESEVE